MFKTLITTAALSVAAASAQAEIPEDAFGGPTLIASDTTHTIEDHAAYETAYYCEWVTVYDYWGNWVTLWQCY